MSDQSPPPKPKPGSLRDRIAAFEKPAAASSGNAPPPPRPKPGNISWKPKQLSPPSSPPAAGAGAGDGGSTTTTTSERFKPTGGMSASDAKESIRSGGSLKERMAALQGKGGFGGPPPPVSPKPAVEKPKWKPPPQVARASADDDDDNDEHDGEVSKKEEGGARGRTSTEEDVKSPAGSARSLGEELASETQTQSHAEGGEEQPSEEVDPEEEERQRRAAIAARMAKLGGARVGMGPPVFGRPMVPKKPEGLKQQEAPTSPPLPSKGKEEAEVVQEGQPESHKSPTLGEAIDSMQEKTKTEDTSAAKEEPKRSDSSSLLSPDSNTSSPQPPSRTPNSMPLPAAPRRAGPPRRKVKSPAPESTPEPSATAEEAAITQEEPSKEEEKGAAMVESESQSDPSSLAAPGGDVQEEIGHVTPTHVEPEPDTEAPGKVLDDEKPIVTEEPPTMKEAEGVPVRDDEDIVEPSSEPKESTGSEAVADTEETAKETAPETAEEEEDDEETRRKRIAERVAKMGGFNPFSLPPQRRPSSDEVPTSPKSEIEPSPKSPSTQSMRKSSTGSGNFPPPPVRRSSQMSAKSPASSLGRKASVDSATSMNVEEENVSAGLARRMSSHDDRHAGASANVEHVTPSGILEETETAEPEKEALSKEPHDDHDDDSVDRISPSSFPAREHIRTSISENNAEDKDTEEDDYELAASKQVDADADEDVEEPIPPPSPPPRVNLSSRPPLPTQPVSNAEPIFVPPPPPKSAPPDDTIRAPTSTQDVPPPVATSAAAMETDEDNDLEEPAPPIPQRRSIPPPPRMIPQTPSENEYNPDAEAEADEDDVAPPVDRSLPATVIPGPSRLPPRPILDDEGEASDTSIPLPHPHPRSIPVPTLAPSQASDVEEDTAVKVIPPRRMVPPPPPPPPQMYDDDEDDSRDEIEERRGDGQEEEILPTPPRRAVTPEQSSPQQEPLIVPPPPPPTSSRPDTIAKRRAVPMPDVVQTDIPAESAQPPLATPNLSVSDHSEVLDDDEGDPIDPSFHSPSRQASTVNLQESVSSSPSSPSPAAPAPLPEPAEEAEDEEQRRRRTIAERMAKLGGIKFGAAPIPTRPPPPPKREATEEETPADEDTREEAASSEMTEEEEERARKERIAAKLASMGGMRIGMMPGMMPPRPPAQSVAAPRSGDPPAPAKSHAHPAPPHRAVPPPVPQTQEVDSEQESQATSEDGIKVEAEESEMEEVSHEDVEEDEAPPPPVPTREGRRVASGSENTVRSPATPNFRPPVPTALPPRRPSTDTVSSVARKSSSGSTSAARTVHRPPQSDYVMVEEPEPVEPVVAPPRIASRPPPARAPPPPAPPSAGLEPTESQWEMPSIPSESAVVPPRSDSRVPPSRAPPRPAPSSAGMDPAESQWEMPSIPSVDFGNNADLSLSWSESDIPAPAKETPTLPAPVTNQVLSADELTEVWGRVGAQVCEVATALHDKSKRALIGDGTYHGFVTAALREVPNAASISPESYGYLIYQQSGGAVQKRASDILPGDVLWMQDAKLKGHKGIHSYQQSVGVGDPLVGIVNEFEAKKFKVRIFQANQHVGQQTVESVSYRLEDLKSGLVKVFRILEA